MSTRYLTCSQCDDEIGSAHEMMVLEEGPEGITKALCSECGEVQNTRPRSLYSVMGDIAYQLGRARALLAYPESQSWNEVINALIQFFEERKQLCPGDGKTK